MKPAELRKIVEQAADRIYYPEIEGYLDKHLDKQFHSLAKGMLQYFLVNRIMDLDSREERKRALDLLPEEDDVPHLKSFVKYTILRLWSKRNVENNVRDKTRFTKRKKNYRKNSKQMEL